MIKSDIAILGGGASGLFLAKHLKGKNFLIVDKSQIPLKLKVSGGGKCNFTNEFVSCDNYTGDKRLIQKVLDCCSNRDVLRFFKDTNYKKIKNNQYFASSSNEIIKKLNQKKFIAEILDVEKKDNFIVHTTKGDIEAKKIVVATGGVSYKKLGSSDIGYKIAKKFGHSIVSLKPALVGLSLQKEQFWMKALSGVGFGVKIKIGKKSFQDNILFSHRGITGPAVLNGSLYWDKGKIEIDFIPNFKILKSNKTISNFLNIPKRFTLEFLKAHKLKDDTLKNSKKAIELLQNYSFAPAGYFGFDMAEITKGGVDTNELEGLESKFVKNLYFIGEVLNINGELGGYNLQWCFSSAKYLNDLLLHNS